MDIAERSRELQIAKLVRSKHFNKYIYTRPRGEILRLSQEIRLNDELYKEEIKRAISIIYFYANKKTT